MKKLLIIPAFFLSTGSMLLTSYGNTDNGSTMKVPVQNNTDTGLKNNSKDKESGEKEEDEKGEKNPIAKPASMISATDAAAKTMDNMLTAFKGETNASAKYAAYSKKAEQEGFHSIALLFKAASTAENIHANNHKAVLQESGVIVPAVKTEFVVKSTKENLEDAIAGETYEATTMYPEFLTTANAAGNQLALISLNYAYKTEKKHKVLYETAMTALQNNTAQSLPVVFFICPTCGNTYETKAPARCGISMTNGEKFIKIISL